MGETRIPNFNTLADLFDRLIVCTNKLAYFENRKRELNADGCVPDETTLAHLAYWDRASRNECEIRNLLKREIDAVFTQAIESGEYKALPDFRTFTPSGKTIADLLAEQCAEIGQRTQDKLRVSE